jgi:Amt family ammonium transporter
VPFVMLGAALLWFGWFGFNAGSALTAGGQSSVVFMNTQVATCTAVIGWLAAEKIQHGKFTTVGAASGAVAGLVAITPACAFVTPVGSIVLGLVAGAVCCLATGLKFRAGIDDALDVVGVHLVGGILGALLIGFLGAAATGIGTNGLFYGGGLAQLFRQGADVGATTGYSFVATFIIAKVVSRVFGGLRVSEDVESEGLDIHLHAESGYDFSPVGGSVRSVPSAHSTGHVATKEVRA